MRSKQQKGQRVAADYYMEPQIVINDSPIGGIGSMIGGLIGNSAVAAVAGHLQTASVVTLTLFDVRSAVQIAASEAARRRRTTARRWAASAAAWAAPPVSTTPEGKATVVAFIDAWNKMVVALRSYKAQDVKGGLGRGGQLQLTRGPAARRRRFVIPDS